MGGLFPVLSPHAEGVVEGGGELLLGPEPALRGANRGVVDEGVGGLLLGPASHVEGLLEGGCAGRTTVVIAGVFFSVPGLIGAVGARTPGYSNSSSSSGRSIFSLFLLGVLWAASPLHRWGSCPLAFRFLPLVEGVFHSVLEATSSP